MGHRLLALLLVVLTGCSAVEVESPPPPPSTPASSTGAAEASPSPGIDLGTAPAGTELTFDVPPNTLGFEIVTSATTTNADAIGVVELRDPDGTAVVPDFASTPNRMVGTGVGVFVYPPIADRAPSAVRAGKWKVKLGGETVDAKNAKGSSARPWSGDVHGSVFLQTSSRGEFAGGVLDLDIYVPPGLTAGEDVVDASSAATNAFVKERIDLVFALESRLYGIERGDVRYHAIDAKVLTLSSIDAIDEANMLATEHGERPSAQLILTSSLEPDGAGNGQIRGISNCLPGAVGVPGTKCSAVVVAFRASPQEDATTIVHELGHFIGLEHTTELEGGYFDSLGDTPECTNTGKGSLSSCPDFTNLMFPTSIAQEDRSVVVSATQARVMHASPLYRATGK